MLRALRWQMGGGLRLTFLWFLLHYSSLILIFFDPVV